MVNQDLILIGAGLLASETSGLTNLTGLGGSESDSGGDQPDIIGGSGSGIDLSGLRRSLRNLSSPSGTNLNLDLGSGGSDLDVPDLPDLTDPVSPEVPDLPDLDSGGAGGSGGSGNLEQFDDNVQDSFRDNSVEVSEMVGGGLAEITVGTVGEFLESSGGLISSGVNQVLPNRNSEFNDSPSQEVTPEQADVQSDLVNPFKDNQEAIQDFRDQVKNQKKDVKNNRNTDLGSSSSGSSSSGSSDSSSGGSSSPNLFNQDKLLEDSEVEGKTEAEAQAEVVEKQFSEFRGSGSKQDNSGSKNKKKKQDQKLSDIASGRGIF